MKALGTPQKVYSVLFLLSLALFVSDFVIQGYVQFSYDDYYGLISKMKWVYWVGYALFIGLVFFHYTNFKKIDKRYAYLTIILAVIYFISTPFIYESLPRFEDTWAHSYLADIFYKTGEYKGAGYVYERYPGSFIFYGLMFNMFDGFMVMKFFPLIFYIIGVLAIYLTLKDLIDPKKVMLIVIIYMLFSWTVEDNHLSPQFLALNLYFIFMLFAVRLFYGAKNRTMYMAMIALLSVAISFSHVFTPIFIMSTMAFTCILCKRLRKTAAIILVIVAIPFLLHDVFFASSVGPLIADSISSIVDGIRNLGELFSISSKFAGTSYLSRQIVIGSRLAILAASVLLGLLGIRTLQKHGYKTTPRFLYAWAFSMLPFLIVIAMFMKGEFAERFVLVSALPLAIASVYFLTYRKAVAVILVLLVVLSPLYFISKYGNEAFESLSVEKLKAECFSAFFESGCDENSVIIESPLNFLDHLGEVHFTLTREDIMFSQIYGKDTDVDIFGEISRIEDERGLDRIYSTNNAWSYVRK